MFVQMSGLKSRAYFSNHYGGGVKFGFKMGGALIYWKVYCH